MVLSRDTYVQSLWLSLQAMLEEYNAYRVQGQRIALVLDSTVEQLLHAGSEALGANALLVRIEVMEQLQHQVTERYFFIINLFTIVNNLTDSLTQLYGIAGELRQGLGSFGVDLLAHHKHLVNFTVLDGDFMISALQGHDSVKQACAQLHFSLDIVVDELHEQDHAIKAEGFDWAIILGGNNE